MAKGEEQTVLTVDVVQKMIADAVAKLVTQEQLAEALKDLLTEEQVRGMIDLAQNEMFDRVNEATMGTITALPDPAAPAPIPLDPKWLLGLTFRSSVPKKGDKGTTNVPIERPLSPKDVLSWSVRGDTVTLVTADGLKHTVDRNRLGSENQVES